MRPLNEIKKILLSHKQELGANYHVKEVGIFGSYVRGEQKNDSDIDVLVDFNDSIGFFQFIDLEDHLSSLLGVKVDLVSRGALKPVIGKYILDEVQMI